MDDTPTAQERAEDEFQERLSRPLIPDDFVLPAYMSSPYAKRPCTGEDDS